MYVLGASPEFGIDGKEWVDGEYPMGYIYT